MSSKSTRADCSAVDSFSLSGLRASGRPKYDRRVNVTIAFQSYDDEFIAKE